jgi:Zn-dependent protease with chaperone function
VGTTTLADTESDGTAHGAGPSRRHRFALALFAGALTVSFYTLLLGVVFVLLGALVLLVRTSPGWGMAAAFPLGLMIATMRRSIMASIPRRLRPNLVGIAISDSMQPGIWAFLSSVSSAVGERPPDSLRLTLGGSAGVRELRVRGGAPNRILVLPLTYLIELSRAQLGAVVAHELGHLAAGDAIFTRWISPVGEALLRSLDKLERAKSVLRYPFRFYAARFFGLTATFSRNHEYAADALSARACGAGVAASALETTAGLQWAFDVFWSTEARPYLDAGLLPPLRDGLRTFLGAPWVRQEVARAAQDPSQASFALHPSNRERLAALRSIKVDSDIIDAEARSPAWDLLVDPAALELELLADLAEAQAGSLRRVSWKEGAAMALPTLWRSVVESHPLAEGELDVSDLAASVVRLIEDASGDQHAVEEGLRACSCALAVALVEDGWVVAKRPGSPAILTKGALSIVPRSEIQGIFGGERTVESWVELCDEFGITALHIGSCGPVGAATPKPRPPALATNEATDLTRPDVRVELKLSDREVDGFVARVAFWFAIVFGIAIAGVCFFVTPAPTTTPDAHLVVRLIGFIIVAGVVWIVWTRRPGRGRGPLLTIDAGVVTLSHPSLLREPARISLSKLRVIAIETGDGTADPERRFPVYSGTAFASHHARKSEPVGWVWPAGRGKLPRFSLGRETPNMLILLQTEIPCPRVRRERLHGPLNGERIWGMFATVKDAPEAAGVLERAGLMKPLTTEDIKRPTPEPVESSVETTTDDERVEAAAKRRW